MKAQTIPYGTKINRWQNNTSRWTVNFNLRKKQSNDDEYNFNRFIDFDGQVIDKGIKLGRTSETWYDCSIFNCDDKTL